MGASTPPTPSEPAAEAAIRIDSHLDGSSERSLADDVLDGLTRPFKELPPKHFYDARGAELFDRICELPEYYPTRTETALLRKHAPEFAEFIGPDAEVVEFGAGSLQKIGYLLGALKSPRNMWGLGDPAAISRAPAAGSSQTVPGGR